MNNWRQILSWEIAQNVSVVLPVWISCPRAYVSQETGELDVGSVEAVVYPRLKNKFLNTIKRILGKDVNLINADLPSDVDYDEEQNILMFQGEVEGPKNLIKKLLITVNNVWPYYKGWQAEEEIVEALKEQATFKK